MGRQRARSSPLSSPAASLPSCRPRLPAGQPASRPSIRFDCAGESAKALWSRRQVHVFIGRATLARRELSVKWSPSGRREGRAKSGLCEQLDAGADAADHRLPSELSVTPADLLAAVASVADVAGVSVWLAVHACGGSGLESPMRIQDRTEESGGRLNLQALVGSRPVGRTWRAADRLTGRAGGRLSASLTSAKCPLSPVCKRAERSCWLELLQWKPCCCRCCRR